MAIFRSTIFLFLLTLNIISKSSAGYATMFHSVQCTPVRIVRDFIDLDNEIGIDFESTRRSLPGRARYISYGALSKDRVLCNCRDTSYYNCNLRTKVNPYKRGCSAITRCAKNLK